MTKEEKIKKQEEKKLYNAALSGAAHEVVQRYGSAEKEHLVAYFGKDNETGKKLTKSLKEISNSRTSEKYYDANIKQQAGFSAEVKGAARRNSEKIIKGDSTRTSRTDDLGRINDQLYDLADVDVNGNIIKGTGSQMKFVGSSPKELLQKLNGQKFKKYLDKNVKIDIADDDYDAIIGTSSQKGIIDEKIEKLYEQVKKLEEKGKIESAEKKLEQVKKYEKIKKNLRKSGLTRKEAIEARINPRLSTAKEISGLAHRAGLEQAKNGTVILGSILLVRNIVSYAKGEKSPEEAAKDLVIGTTTGAVISYVTAFTGSLIKSSLQNSEFGTLQAVSKTNLPARLVSTTLNVGKVMSNYIKGDIDGTECIEQLGKDGFAEISSAMLATVGAALGGKGALSIIGGIVGSTVGYAAAAAVYQELATSLKEAKLAREERIRIEKECQEAIELIEQYRREMNVQVKNYLFESICLFSESFIEMDKAICENDINGFISGNTQIQKLLGREIQYETQEEFDELMLSDITFKL